MTEYHKVSRLRLRLWPLAFESPRKFITKDFLFLMIFAKIICIFLNQLFCLWSNFMRYCSLRCIIFFFTISIHFNIKYHHLYYCHFPLIPSTDNLFNALRAAPFPTAIPNHIAPQDQPPTTHTTAIPAHLTITHNMASTSERELVVTGDQITCPFPNPILYVCPSSPSSPSVS